MGFRRPRRRPTFTSYRLIDNSNPQNPNRVIETYVSDDPERALLMARNGLNMWFKRRPNLIRYMFDCSPPAWIEPIH